MNQLKSELETFLQLLEADSYCQFKFKKEIKSLRAASDKAKAPTGDPAAIDFAADGVLAAINSLNSAYHQLKGKLPPVGPSKSTKRAKEPTP